MRRAHVDKKVIDAVASGRVALPPDAAHRLAHVLRLAVGERVEIFDGTGRVARGSFTPPAHLDDVEVLTVGDGLPPLIVAQAVTKTDKLELVVKKGTELGASAFVLVACARSQVHLGDRAEKRVERLLRIAEDAARQSGRATVPEISGPEGIAALAARIGAFAGLSAFGAVGAAPLSTALAAHADLDASGMLVVIGPEGGLDPGETAALAAAGAVPAGLGAHVLRTETAALAALAAAQVALGRL